MNADPIAALRRAFPDLSDEKIEELASVAQVRTYPPDTVLCHEGQEEHTFYIIVSGRAEVSKRLDDQTSRVLYRPGPGEFFGEIALVQRAPRIATVRTLETTTVLEIGREAFERMLECTPRMALQIIRQVSARLRDTDQRAIDDLRQKNVELAQAYAELEEQQRLRSEFLTTVAHELRTPLTAATGFLHLLRSGAVSPEQQAEVLETVSRNLDTVVHLVNSILFLQELEMITPEFQPLALGDIVLRAVQEVRERAERAGIRLQVEVEPGLPILRGDPMGLKRAVMALLDNAIKFSPDGGVVRVEALRDGDQIGIRVSDPGVGILPDELDWILEPFTRGHSPRGHLFGGIGLGLSIARHVVELHGGRIEVESRVGEGSTFTILLPAG